MHRLFAFARFYPFYALSASWILAYMGLFYRRKGNDTVGFICYAFVGMFIVTSIAWLGFRGDLHSDEWVRSLAQSD